MEIRNYEPILEKSCQEWHDENAFFTVKFPGMSMPDGVSMN
jgi:hypothetical protein